MKQRSTVRAIGGLTFANAATTLSAFVTAPILARNLGPDGRGALASVLVPLALAPIIAQLGIGAYVVREAARGRSSRELVGSVGPPLLAVAALVAILAPQLSSLFIPDGGTAHTLLEIGFSILGIALFANLIQDIAWGRERWRLLTIVRAIPPVAFAAALAVLAVLDHVSVRSAVVAMWVTSFLVYIPLSGTIKEAWRPKFRMSVMREGYSFGIRSWPGALGQVMNQRLDQLLMIRLVSVHELGLYAVAVNVAAFPALATSAFGSYVFPRVAGGDERVVARALRVAVLLTFLLGSITALATPVGVNLVFGEAFKDAIPMILILLIGLVPMTLFSILNPALTGAGIPAAGTYGELAALAITVPGLIIVLPLIGGIGAAIVSSFAYTVSATILLLIARKRFQQPLRELLLPTGDDVRWLRDAVRARRGQPEVLPEPSYTEEVPEVP